MSDPTLSFPATLGLRHASDCLAKEKEFSRLRDLLSAEL